MWNRTNNKLTNLENVIFGPQKFNPDKPPRELQAWYDALTDEQLKDPGALPHPRPARWTGRGVAVRGQVSYFLTWI